MSEAARQHRSGGIGGSHPRKAHAHLAGVDRVGLVVGAAMAAVVFAVTWFRHRQFLSGFDLAIFDQAAWQLSHGRAHISIVERHVLADHFSPVMLVFGPLYRVAATPAWLLGAQAVAVGATVLPVRALGRHLGVDSRIATFLAVVSAPILAAAYFDFHPSTLAVPLVAAAVLFAVQDRPRAATLATVGVALCRADLAPVIVAVALVAGPRSRLRLAVVGAVAAAVGAFVPGLVGETSGWSPHFGHLGDSPIDAALHPWRIIGELLSSSSLSIVLLWVLAAGLAVVLQPRWVLAVVVAGLPVLLSRWSGTELPWYHYGAVMAPVAIGGTLVQLSVRPSPRLAIAARAPTVALVAPVLALVVGSPLAPTSPEEIRVWTLATSRDVDLLTSLVDEVGPHEAVSADLPLLPHLSQRQRAYLYPVPYGVPAGFWAPGAEPDLDEYDPASIDVVVGLSRLDHLVPRPPFAVVRTADGFSVLRRAGGDPGHRTAVPSTDGIARL